jgi:tetratricopeptide (TPR) repeat protein
MLGNLEAAREHGRKALEAASKEIPIMASAIHAGQALVLARDGDLEEACRLADIAMQGFEASAVPSVLTTSLIGPMNAYLGAWHEARENEPERVPLYSTKAKKHLESFRKFAKIYPMAGAFFHLAAGQVCLLDGKRELARRSFERALSQAHRRRLRHVEGLCHGELARLSPRRTNERHLHLEAAATIFGELGTIPDLKSIRHLQSADEAKNQ